MFWLNFYNKVHVDDWGFVLLQDKKTLWTYTITKLITHLLIDLFIDWFNYLFICMPSINLKHSYILGLKSSNSGTVNKKYTHNQS